MYAIKPLNNIAKCGLDVFNKDLYEVNDQSENPDGIILRSFNMHDMEFPENLKGIARAGAGVNNIPVQSCSEKGIVVFNTPGANANAVKELVLATILASSRNLIDGVSWVKTLEGEGEKVPKLVEAGKKEFVGREIAGKTLGVIGLGAVGALVANSALALDMEVMGFDPFISVDTAWNLSRNVQRAMTIEQIFSSCDFITVHVPLTEQTRGMFNKEAFSLMKNNVKILNFSRGELANEEDLKAAIESGIVGKYITDFPNENVINMKNVIAIPHLGASTKESEENCAIMAARQLKNYIETGNIKNSVNFANVELPYVGKRRITIAHHNVPNMVGQITAILAHYHLNIADMLNRSKGEFAYTLIDIDNEVEDAIVPELKEKIKTVSGVVRVRVI
ncbi:D-3-phosphoglycerate dehydrogenase [Oikeobacillus pervagus]|uniref:D-3-phosphoglycerate dehydrogenase n=1 Tax=Oikeobacillus pervagus TaxID=1325931 RepID=A0AAJ1WJ39_9BACI|nr:phosphoglycerate dehydrogenase [Oikeobacillus pervagus]MDQ0215295.1 D-3-phosphoglycerate dehydrogenase [Oikeobacillus pervagus]